jgi:hypothetical protein
MALGRSMMDVSKVILLFKYSCKNNAQLMEFKPVVQGLLNKGLIYMFSFLIGNTLFYLSKHALLSMEDL